MNKVLLSGFLGQEPELRRTNSGKSVCNLSLAVRRSQEITDFIPVTCWQVTADFAAKYFKKGSRIEVCGRLQKRTWKDEAGTNHSTLEVIAESVEFGERPPGISGASAPPGPEAPSPVTSGVAEPPSCISNSTQTPGG